MRSTCAHRSLRRAALAGLESLEARRLLAASLAGGVLTVAGTAGNDFINLSIGTGNYKVTLNNGAAQLFAVAGVDSVVINCGDGADGVFLENAVDPVQVSGGNGFDNVEVGWGQNRISDIQATVTFDGGADDDKADVWDNAATNQTFNISGNTVTRSGWAGQLIYQSCSIVQVQAGDGNDTFNVSQVPAGTAAKLFAWFGDDVCNVGSGNLDNIAGSVFFSGEEGADVIQINDQANSRNDAYTITTNNVGRTGTPAFGGLEYWNSESMVLNAASGNNAIVVASIPQGMPTTINGGGGNDNLIVGGSAGAGNLDNVKSALTWSGGAGTDAVTIDDAAATTARTFTINTGAVTLSSGGPGGGGASTFGGVFYGDAESVTLNGPTLSTLHNTFRINGTPANRPFGIHGGAGSDTFIVGGGSPISGAGGNLDPLLGPLLINGGSGSGFDFINVNDSGNTFNDAFTLTATTVTRDSWAGGLTYGGAEQIAINAGSGANVIHFNGSPTEAQVTINAGEGNDTIDVGTPGQTLNGIFGTHSLIGGGGVDALTLHDGQNTIPVVWYINPASVARWPENSDPSTFLGYEQMESLRLEGTLGGNTIQVTDTSAATPVTIAPGLNFDNAINVINSATPVTILPGVGAGGGPSVTVNTGGDGGPAAVMFPHTMRLANLFIYDGGMATVAADANALLHVTTLMLIFPTGKLDLADNDLAVDYNGATSPIGAWDGVAYTGLSGQIQRAYDFSAWDGSGGITTSMADAAGGLTTLAINEASDTLFISGNQTALFDGETVDATTVLVKYTYAGDVNLDGLVDAQDYGIIDNYFQFPGSRGYANGDFNFDGVIDAGDYGYIDNSFQLQGSPL